MAVNFTSVTFDDKEKKKTALCRPIIVCFVVINRRVWFQTQPYDIPQNQYF